LFFFVSAALHGTKKLDKTDEVDKSRRLGETRGGEKLKVFITSQACQSALLIHQTVREKNLFFLPKFTV
jgi:hypothetical protein